MTPNLHDKILAAIDAYFSASRLAERDQAEEQLLDVRDEILKQPAREPLTDEQIEIGRRAPWGEALDPFTAGVRFAETRHDITKGGAA